MLLVKKMCVLESGKGLNFDNHVFFIVITSLARYWPMCGRFYYDGAGGRHEGAFLFDHRYPSLPTKSSARKCV